MQPDGGRENRTTDQISGSGGQVEASGHALVIVRGPYLGMKVDVPRAGLVIGRAHTCDLVIGTSRDGTSRRHARLTAEESAIVVEDLGSTNGLVVNRQACRKSRLFPGDLLQIGATLFKVIGDCEEMRFHELMYDLVVRDSLTGLYNRAYLESALAQEIAKVQRGNGPLSVVLIDIDRFKQTNDQHGHVVGDSVLVEFGRLLRSLLRSEDIACRYGGDEFLVVLARADRETALEWAERCRQETARHRFGEADHAVPLTVSIGVAELSNEIDRPESMILAADDALLRSKRVGRNRVEISQTIDNADTRPLRPYHPGPSEGDQA